MYDECFTACERQSIGLAALDGSFDDTQAQFHGGLEARRDHVLRHATRILRPPNRSQRGHKRRIHLNVPLDCSHARWKRREVRRDC